MKAVLGSKDAGAGRLLLQKRDITALTHTYRHGVLLRDDLGALAFPGSTRRVVGRRLQRLVGAGLLEANILPLGAFPLGLGDLLPHPGQFAYRVTQQGAQVVAESLEADLSLVRRRLQAPPSYIGHAVAVAKISVALHRFASAQDYQVHQFLCEGDARHRYRWKRSGQADDWKTEELRPDGLALLHYQGKLLPVHIEADMATQGKTALLTKLEGYRLYVRLGALARRFEGSSLFLGIVTTSPERVQVILRLLQELQATELSGVAVTTFALLTTSGLTAPIWKSASATHLSTSARPSTSMKGLLPCSV